jgi:acetyltransferase
MPTKKKKSAKKQPQRHPLDAIFRPRSVAVVGASSRKLTIGREILHNMIDFEFTGPVYPINPKSSVVHSMRAYKTLKDVPDDIDLVVVSVPRERVMQVIEECGRKGVKGLVMITAGFKEVGEEGAALEKKLAVKLDRYGMRMVGPNCMGVINTEPSVRLNATFASSLPERGKVGFISHSGALGEAILADAARTGIGVSMFVSLGNRTDISGNDLLEYWEHNDEVQTILMYLESFGKPRRFTELARRVTRKKPIITVKAGRTAAGARAASSHTGSIVGLDIAVESLFEQTGVLRVGSLEEMFVQASAFVKQPLPRGDRIAIVTNAGGPGILCTDACIGRGLKMAELRPATLKALAKVLPPEAAISNPVDMIASAEGEQYKKVLDLVKKDPNVDGIVAIFVSPVMIDALKVAHAIADSADGKKPVMSVFMGKQRWDEGMEYLNQHKVPVYRFPEEAASAMSAMARYRARRDEPQGEEVTFRVHKGRARAAIKAARKEGRRDLSPSEVRSLLEAYGLPLAPCRSASSAAEAIAAAQELGYPVVLKVDSEKISHKSDLGGVKIDLRNADEVGSTYRELVAGFRRRDPKMKVMVQKMVRGGKEVILGMTRDQQFGPLLMFGLGGIFVEVMKDVSVGVHPLTDVMARKMIEKIKGYPLLAGARGEKPVDVKFLLEALLRLNQLVSDFRDDLAELDLNPFIITERSGNSFVVDARVSLR